MEGRPNILLITTDTQRWDTLSCMGNPSAISPNLDRLADEGVLFRNAHTSCPVCMPARCSLLTGVHTPIHGVIQNGLQRHRHLTLFPELLQAGGYTNIMVGKTHFGPVRDCFDVEFILRGEKSAQSDDFYGEHLRHHGYNRATSHPNPVPEELFSEAFLVDTTIRAIDEVVAAGKGPFFAFCSMLSPHEPVDPPGRWATIYADRTLPPLNYSDGEIAAHPEHLRRVIGLPGEARRGLVKNGNLDRQAIEEWRRLYYGLAAYCDAQVGRLVDYLDSSGLRRNTLVIFTSDHGTQLYDHGIHSKHNFYDSTWRVPLIMSLPGTLPSGAQRGFAIWNDLTATILGAAGVDCPSVQGFDLFSPLRNGEPSPRTVAVSVLYKACALATNRWKLEYYFEEGQGRLFDRLNDPLEQVDLYKNVDYASVRQGLLHALLSWRGDLVDVQQLIANTGGGGPVARRTAQLTRAMRGTDAELRLQEKVAELEERWGSVPN